jgi:hypothetical protein
MRFFSTKAPGQHPLDHPREWLIVLRVGSPSWPPLACLLPSVPPPHGGGRRPRPPYQVSAGASEFHLRICGGLVVLGLGLRWRPVWLRGALGHRHDPHCPRRVTQFRPQIRWPRLPLRSDLGLRHRDCQLTLRDRGRAVI